MLKKILLTSCLCFMMGCSSSSIASYNANVKTNVIAKNDNIKKQEILKQYNKWVGTKYKYGGTTKKGVDCSAFIGHVYRDGFNLNLPRTTTELKHKGKYVSKNNLKYGDMVFFRKNKHVGIYIGNNQFIHASSKKGVITSRLDTGYYAKAYTQARRVLNH